jgi:hypothetical protein
MAVESWAATVPKRRQRHYSYDESLDEPATLIADEPAEIEHEAPAEEAESVERIEADFPSEPSAFEDSEKSRNP